MTKSGTLKYLLGSVFVLVYMFMLAPVVVVVLLSFNESRSGSFPITGFTLEWYRLLFDDEQFLSALRISLWLAFWSTLAAVVIGTMAAYAISRLSFRGRSFLELTMTLPLIMPHVVLGVSLLLAFGLIGLGKNMWSLWLGHLVIILPYVVIMTRHRLQSIPPLLDEAAATLGADRLTIIRTVIVPLALPAIVIGSLFAFMQSFDEVTATMFWRPVNTETVQTYIINLLAFDLDPKVNAVAGVLVLFSLFVPLFALCAGRLLSWATRSRK